MLTIELKSEESASESERKKFIYIAEKRNPYVAKKKQGRKMLKQAWKLECYTNLSRDVRWNDAQ